MTQWGELDYLIFDTPPGTGDIAISLGQEIKYTAAVIVTTPQRLAYIDVIKGIEMWDELKVPTVSVVENMAYLQETDSDIKQFIFGRGHVNNLKENFGIKNSFEVPIRSAISKYSDLGTRPLPKVPRRPGSSQGGHCHQDLQVPGRKPRQRMRCPRKERKSSTQCAI
jgi:Mrp family chromosome partitioning ATPase